jgi:Zn-dependent protease
MEGERRGTGDLLCGSGCTARFVGGDRAPGKIMHLQLAEAISNVLLLWMLTAPHEFAHAWVATKLGDDTPLREGRVTLNPLAHVDWIGTALLPFVTSLMGAGFLGWGRPVNTDNRKLKFGMNGLALVALAGPFSNVVLAVIMAAVAIGAQSSSPALSEFAAHGVMLSLYLGLFNMLPVPPLDGSKLLLAARIPMRIYFEISRMGLLFLVLIMSFTNVGRWMSDMSFRGAYALLHVFRA